jgi:hypothetical protein
MLALPVEEAVLYQSDGTVFWDRLVRSWTIVPC